MPTTRGASSPGPDVRGRVLDIDNHGRPTVDITPQIRDFCSDLGGDGLLSVFVPHATAGLALVETGAGSDNDLVDALRRLLPRDERYRHRHGSRGHGADHVLPAIISPSLTVPVHDGTPQLGTWQAIMLIDLNDDNPHRQVRLSLLAG